MKSIRGAIASIPNDEFKIIEASKKLITSIIEINNIKEDDIVFALFSVTSDLNKAFPARAFREIGFTSVACLDSVAPKVDNDLSGCIRILLTVNKNLQNTKHVYLNDAKKLRPDR